MNLNSLKSYAFNQKKTQGEDEWEWWQREYKISLETKVFCSGQRSRNFAGIYCDPDEGNPEYYTALCSFLNQQEEKTFFPKKDRFLYCCDEYKKHSRIKVCQGDTILFYLKTDQFGFSAPRTGNKLDSQKVRPHPYAVYYEKKKDKDQAIENIVRWIYITRTLGGSFLWPEEEGSNQRPYNWVRGGSRYPQGSTYINDRVDFTLLEISHFYEVLKDKKEWDLNEFVSEYIKKFPCDILGKTLAKSPFLFQWLSHFGDFKKYLKFFQYEMFIEDGKVIDISRGTTIMSGNYSKEETKSIKKNFWEMKDTEFEKMFDLLCSKIEDRTSQMEGIIGGKTGS